MRTADGYIINKCLNGDSAAFGLLVDKYRAGVYALAYSKLRDFRDAEDVSQEVFIKAYRKLRSLRRWDSFHAWLYAITSNMCKDWIQARARRPDREFIEDQNQETLEEPSMDYYREDLLRESVHEALDLLPETYRQTLTLYYLGGMSSQEIAEFLGTSPTAIRHRLTRGRSQLKEGMLAMISDTYKQRRLHTSFTFRIVEMVKRIRIRPVPKSPWLPWGLSAATGIIIALLGLGSILPASNPMGATISSAATGETRVMKTGELPVDVLAVSETPLVDMQESVDIMPSSHQNDLSSTPPQVVEMPLLAGGQGVIDTDLTYSFNGILAPHQRKGRTGAKWTKKTHIPTQRFAFAVCALDGKIYVIGGSKSGVYLSTVEEYDPATDEWRKKADMPTARDRLSACAVGGKLYAIGGSRVSDGIVEEYDPATDRWTRKTNMPTPRRDLSTSVVNGKIYAIGGRNGKVRYLPAVEEYDPTMDKWTKRTNILTPRGDLSTSAANGKIYAIGGRDRIDNKYRYFPAVEEYDPATDKWTKRADMPTPRYLLSTFSLNGRVYALGGWGTGNDHRPLAVEEYNPVTDTWTKKDELPRAKGDVKAAVVKGKVYTIGGKVPVDFPDVKVREYNTELNFARAREEYDDRFHIHKAEGSDTGIWWRGRADMPTARSGFAASAVYGKVYVIGGQESPFDIEVDRGVIRVVGSHEVRVPLPTVTEYDPIADKWTKKTDMPTARVNLAAAALNGKIYAIGGWDGVGNPSAVCSTVEEYDPTTDTWTAKAHMPTARGALAVSILNGRIYAIGGISSDGWAVPTVEEYDPATDRWTKKADMLTERGYFSASATDGRIYATGGVNNKSMPLSTTEAYNPATDRWTMKERASTDWKYHLSTSALNGKIYAMGGWLSSGRPALTLEEYNPVTDGWKKKSDMIPSMNVRGDVSTVAVNGTILVFGGQRAVDVRVFAVEEYRIDAAPTYMLENAIIGKWKGVGRTASVSMEFFVDGTCRMFDNEKLSEEAHYEFIEANRIRLGSGSLEVRIRKDKLFLSHPNGSTMEAIRVTENAKPE